MNLFNIPATDQSVAFLIQIFGTVGGVLPATKGGPILLGTLFKAFNTVMLTLGALLIVYTTVVGLLATAHEGEFMGKKWSGLWVPLRSLIGITALFPTASGYSVLQIIIMWVILQGVGAADMIWTTALNYIEVAGSPLSQPSVPAVGVEGKINTLFQGLACQASSLLKSKYDDKSWFYCADHSDEYCNSTNEELLNVRTRATIEGANYVYKMGPNGTCGTLSYCDPGPFCIAGEASGARDDRLKCETCKAQKAAFEQIVPTLGAVAAKFVQVDNEYIKFGMTPKTDKQNVPGWINAYCEGLKGVKECCIWKYAAGPYGTLVPEPCASATSFPSSIISKEEWVSPSEAAVKTLYYPFGVQPYLNGVNFTSAAVGYYMSAVTGAVATFIQTLKPTELTADWRKRAQENGWIMAGAFYNAIADDQNKALDRARPDFNVNVMLDQSNVMFGYRNNYKGANFLINQFIESSNATASPEMNRLSTELGATAREIFNNWRDSLRSGTSSNPLAELHLFGKRLLIVAEVFYPIILAAAVIAGASDISFIALGTGFTSSPMRIVGYLIFYGFMPLAFFFVGFCLTFGGLLAVYVPLIPYIIFTMTALGWFISTLEAMIASPLIALGILSPGGQHEIMGRSEPALMLLLGVLLRPTLMIFGLMGAMLLSYAALLFVNNTFGRVMSDITERPTITELIMFCAAYVFLIISILNKSFSLIHLIPERVMTWIGGQAVTYGEGEALGEVKRGTEGGGGAVAGGAKAGGEITKGHVGKAAKQRLQAKPKGPNY